MQHACHFKVQLDAALRHVMRSASRDSDPRLNVENVGTLLRTLRTTDFAANPLASLANVNALSSYSGVGGLLPSATVVLRRRLPPMAPKRKFDDNSEGPSSSDPTTDLQQRTCRGLSGWSTCYLCEGTAHNRKGKSCAFKGMLSKSPSPHSMVTIYEGQRRLEDSKKPFGTIVAHRSPPWNRKFREAFNRVVTKEDADKMMVRVSCDFEVPRRFHAYMCRVLRRIFFCLSFKPR